MRNGTRIIAISLLMCIQLVLAKYCQWGLLYICLLPAIILCLPTERSSWTLMVEAFALALITDCVGDGIPGLNAVAAVPCAALQKSIINLCIDGNLVRRGYCFSFRQHGYMKITSALLCEYAVFFILYVIFDSAGTRSFGLNAGKILISGLVSMVFGLIVCSVLCPDKR